MASHLPIGLGTVDVASYARESGLAALVGEVTAVSGSVFDSVDPRNRTPFAPELPDLVRLHKLVRDRKVTTVLEFGVGWSTVVLAHALLRNRAEFAAAIEGKLRRSNPFEVHSVDDDREFIESTRRRLTGDLAKAASLHFSECEMGTFASRVCTFYKSLPNICPDFIYLDGPAQFSVTGDVRGISTRHADRLPMAADILAIEHFLLPGTLVLVDGRTANARFLRANLQRNWRYHHLGEDDVHVFELAEAPLGMYNRRQIEFCLGPAWLADIEKEG